MGDLLGLILPMLLQGSGIGDIFRAMAGSGHGASFDGLQDVLRRQAENASRRFKLRPSDATIAAGAENFLGSIGINPISGHGQGMAQLISAGYGIAPDIIGAMIGVPDPGSLFRQVSNGAIGISMASGHGMPSIFNPYSMLGAHQRAVGMARTAYDIATNGGNGYDASFGHGLNFGEMGRITQRLLSSDIAYTDDQGNRIDPDRDADRFRDRLKKLGSKFNEAASMLTKVTGSLDESLAFMDRISGGNFLGGTEEQALAVARRAKGMAASMRLTSAMAGMDPKEAYASMMGVQSSLAGRFGVDPVLAQASGFSDLMTHPAYMAMMSYQAWLANNPNATPQERQTMMAGAQGRVMSYAGSSGQALAAMISAHMDRFSPEELDRIKEMYRSGNPQEALNMAKRALGDSAVADYMNDPSAIQTFMLTGNKEFQNEMWSAGVQGNLQQATMEGAKRDLRNTLDYMDVELEKATGKGSGRGRTDAVKTALAAMAEKYVGRDRASGMSTRQLERVLAENGVDGGDIQSAERLAEIDDEIASVERSTMTWREESEAKRKMAEVIRRSGREDSQSLIDELNSENGDISAIARKLGLSDWETREITGGKLSRYRSGKFIEELRDKRRTWSGEVTDEEMKSARAIERNRRVIRSQGILAGTLGGEGFGKAATDRDALKLLADAAKGLEGEGQLVTGDENLSDVGNSTTFMDAAETMVGKLLGGSLGDLKEGSKEYKDLVSDLAWSVMAGVKSGKSVEEGFRSGVERILETGDTDGIGGNGIEVLKEWASDPAKFRDEVNRKELGSALVGIIHGRTAEALEKNPDSIKADEAMVRQLAKNGKLNRMFAGLGGKGRQALINIISTMQAEAGGDFDISRLELSDEQIAAITAADDAAGDRAFNRLGKAVNMGGGGYYAESVKRGREQLEELSRVLRGQVTAEDLEGFAAGNEAASKRIDEALNGRANAEYEKELVRQVAGSRFGKDSRSGASILSGDKAGRDSISDEEMARTVKSTNKATAGVSDVYEKLSEILSFLTMILSNPIATMVRNGV